MLSAIRMYMENSKHLKDIVPIVQNTKIMKWRHEKILHKIDMVLAEKAEKQKETFRSCCEAHQSDLEKVFQLLADDYSRRTLQAVIEYRLDPTPPHQENLQSIMVLPQYFVQDILKPVENEVFVDGGAYFGDTVISFISEFGKGEDYYKKIYAWEPEKVKLKNLTRISKIHSNIEVLPYGMWSKKDELHFNGSQDGSSRVDENGSESVKVDSIDNLCSDEKITLIKMDIEGSEAEALRGAKNVICRDKPRLAICIYHKPEDLFQIPFLVKEILPEYKLYIRHHSENQCETVLYAVCDSTSAS